MTMAARSTAAGIRSVSAAARISTGADSPGRGQTSREGSPGRVCL
jgi:hypothetical protein